MYYQSVCMKGGESYQQEDPTEGGSSLAPYVFTCLEFTCKPPSASWAIDSEPIRARGIIVNYFYFIDGEYILLTTVQRKSRLVKKLLIFFTEISGIGFNYIDIINMPEEFQKNRCSRSP